MRTGTRRVLIGANGAVGIAAWIAMELSDPEPWWLGALAISSFVVAGLLIPWRHPDEPKR